MNILLIGATGKIGKNLLTNKFSDKYDNVYALVRSDKNVKLVESAGMIAIKNDIENYDFELTLKRIIDMKNESVVELVEKDFMFLECKRFAIFDRCFLVFYSDEMTETQKAVFNRGAIGVFADFVLFYGLTDLNAPYEKGMKTQCFDSLRRNLPSSISFSFREMGVFEENFSGYYEELEMSQQLFELLPRLDDEIKESKCCEEEGALSETETSRDLFSIRK